MNALTKTPGRALRASMAVAVIGLLAGACGGTGSDTAANPQAAMRAHIAANSDARGYKIFDGPTGKLMQLKFTKLHTKVKQKGDYHVSCADFQDAAGNKFDVDFVAAKTKSGYRVMEAWLHKKDGVKRPYFVAN